MEDVHRVEDLNSEVDTVHRVMVADYADAVRSAWDDGRLGEDSWNGRDGGRRQADEIF